MEQELTENEPLRMVTIPFEFSPSSKAKLAILNLWERISKYPIILLGGGELTEEQEKHNQRVDLIHAKLKARIIKRYGVEEEYLAQYSKRRADIQAKITDLIAELQNEIEDIDRDIQLIST